MKAKYRVIYRFTDKYPVIQMCNFFGVSRSGYYDWVKRVSKEDKDKELLYLLVECHKKSKGTYGYRRAVIWLNREHGMSVNHKAVARIMMKHGLQAVIRRKRKYYHSKANHFYYENIFNQNFNAEAPNQKWVTDISYIHTNEGFLYLSVIKDLYDGYIVGYKTGTAQNINIVTESIRQAIRKEGRTAGLILHSDQGLQYRSYVYNRITSANDITPSMSRRGNCYDNASVENFFGSLKTECIYRQKIHTHEQAKELIDDYIYFYNYQRITLKTKQTPYEKRASFK